MDSSSILMNYKEKDEHGLSIGTKINAVFIMMLILFIVFSMYNRTVLSTFSSNYTGQINTYSTILNLKTEIVACDKSINAYLRTGNRTNLADFNDSSTEIRITLEGLKGELKEEEVTYLLRSITNSFASYYSECSNASFAYATESYDYYSRIYYANDINDYLLTYCDELLELILQKSVEDNGAFLEEYNQLTMFNDLVIGFGSLFSLFIVFYVIHYITKPLNELVSKVGLMSKGDLSVQVKEYKGRSTIGLLGQTFNQMARNIGNMMDDLKEKVEIESQLLEEKRLNVENKERLNHAIMLALQTQTNPHFLFNTLNTISRTVTLGRSNDAVKMIDSLSGLMRYSLTDPEIPVSLMEELRMTKYYMDIQSYRFSDHLQIKTVYPAKVDYDIKLPRFSIQPFIENAIIHGFKNKEELWNLVISVKEYPSGTYIRIWDDGIGMTQEKLKDLFEKHSELKTDHIGISNTKGRLEIFTGDREVISIRSRRNRGTLITIRLLKGEDHVQDYDCR